MQGSARRSYFPYAGRAWSLVHEPSDESLMIETDKNRVFQVISNLIGNAAKFTKEGSISYGYKRVGEPNRFHVTGYRNRH